MAEKISRPIKKRSGGSAAGSDDLQTLFPNQTIIVSGQEVTLREYTFQEGLELRHLVSPLLDALRQLLVRDVPSIYEVQDLLATHADSTVQLIAASAGVTPEWVRALPQEEGEHLMNAWWGVVGPFFIRSAIGGLRRERLLAELRKQHDGPTSSPGSSKPDTDPARSRTTH